MSNGGKAQGTEGPRSAEDVSSRRRIGRELLAEAEAIAGLLASDTAALGSDEVKFLARLRDALIARASELNDIAATEPPARPPAPQRGSAAMTESEPSPAHKSKGRGAMDLARVVVVSYLMFLFAYMGYLFARSHLMQVDVTEDIVDMFKLFLLPLVVLVLGFAFGASRR